MGHLVRPGRRRLAPGAAFPGSRTPAADLAPGREPPPEPPSGARHATAPGDGDRGARPPPPAGPPPRPARHAPGHARLFGARLAHARDVLLAVRAAGRDPDLVGAEAGAQQLGVGLVRLDAARKDPHG